jgi:hypothetical protein
VVHPRGGLTSRGRHRPTIGATAPIGVWGALTQVWPPAGFPHHSGFFSPVDACRKDEPVARAGAASSKKDASRTLKNPAIPRIASWKVPAAPRRGGLDLLLFKTSVWCITRRSVTPGNWPFPEPRFPSVPHAKAGRLNFDATKKGRETPIHCSQLDRSNRLLRLKSIPELFHPKAQQRAGPELEPASVALHRFEDGWTRAGQAAEASWKAGDDGQPLASEPPGRAAEKQLRRMQLAETAPDCRRRRAVSSRTDRQKTRAMSRTSRARHLSHPSPRRADIPRSAAMPQQSAQWCGRGRISHRPPPAGTAQKFRWLAAL